MVVVEAKVPPLPPHREVTRRNTVIIVARRTPELLGKAAEAAVSRDRKDRRNDGIE